MPAIEERTDRKCSLPSQRRALVPHRETTNPNCERLGRVYKVWYTQATHTQQEAHSQLQHTQESSGEKLLSPKTVRGTGKLWSALTEKDFVLFGEVGLVLQCGGHTEMILKEDPRRNLTETLVLVHMRVCIAALPTKKPE